MCDAEVGTNERLERGRLQRCLQCLEGAAHQAEVDGADDRRIPDGRVAERAGAHRDSLTAALAVQARPEPEDLEQLHHLRGRFLRSRAAGLRLHERASVRPPRLFGELCVPAAGERVGEDLGEQAKAPRPVLEGARNELVDMSRPAAAAGTRPLFRDQFCLGEDRQMPANGVDVQADPVGQGAGVEPVGGRFQDAQEREP